MATDRTHMQMTTTAVTIPTTTETVIITSDTLTLAPIGGQGYRVNSLCNFTAGTGTTSVTVRVRQNSLTGTVVATNTALQTAGAAIAVVDALDAAAALNPVANYVITLQQVGATANGTTSYQTIAIHPVTSAS